MPEATSDAFMGLGMPAQISAILGANPHNLTCAGTSQTTAAILKSRNTELTAAASQTGAVPPTTAGVMEPYFIVNSSSTAAVVYVPVGHTLNGTLNSSILSGTGLIQWRSVILYQYKPKFWTFNLGSTT